MFWRVSAPFFCAALFTLSGCKQEIGDECNNSSDCHPSEPRVCLSEEFEHFPGGYCSVFNCSADEGSCPEESVCVAYRSQLSGPVECSDPYATSRLQRTFCMQKCSSQSECRGGYSCLDVTAPEQPWGARLLLEPGKKKSNICALAYEPPDEEQVDEGKTGVCRSAAVEPKAEATPAFDAAAPDAGPR